MHWNLTTENAKITKIRTATSVRVEGLKFFAGRAVNGAFGFCEHRFGDAGEFFDAGADGVRLGVGKVEAKGISAAADVEVGAGDDEDVFADGVSGEFGGVDFG